MSFPWVVTLLIAVADLVLGGLISNGFMVTMMVTEWAKYKRLGSSGQLLLNVGLSNICSTFSMAAIWINDSVSNSDNNVWSQIILSFGVFVTCFRLWLAAWLCAFYYIKIVNSTCSFILWCKQQISWIIPRLLVGTLLICFCISSLTGLSMAMYWSNRTGNITNGIQGKEQTDIFSYLEMFFIISGNVCPFVVALLCSILSIASLGRHLHHMRSRESSFESFQTKAHIKAVGTMVALLFLHISLYVVQTLLSKVDTMQETIIFPSRLVTILCSPLQAAILVLANPKLKGIAIQILQRTQI